MIAGRALFTLAAIALIALQWLWHGWLDQNLAFSLMLSVPLVMPLPWLLKGSLRAAVVTCFVSLIHFMHGLTEAVVTPESLPMALTETGLCLSLYCALVVWTAGQRRARQRGGSQ